MDFPSISVSKTKDHARTMYRNCPTNLSDWDNLARDAGYRVSALARLVKLPPKQLRRFFQRHFRINPKNGLKEFQLRKAAKALGQGARPKEAFRQTDFSDFANFSTAFRKFHGVPPSRLQPNEPEPTPLSFDI